MTINLNAPQMTELKPRIVVIGVGGAGGNAVNNMISSGLDGVEFIVANTDSQALAQSTAERRIQMGVNITQGLGCGARPDIGRAAAEEAIDQILDHMAGTHMAFITAGMGGGTGTGAAPVIAEALRNQGILTVGVVTKPFQFEGGQRLLSAERGIEELQSFVDTLIVIPNQNLFRIANEKTTFADAFAMADDVLHSGVRGITDLMVLPGLINLDFADVKTVMAEMGKAMMGTGEAEGEKRAIDAAEAAISNPLLDDVSMQGARGVLINITGGLDLTLYEVDEAANRVRQEVDPNANIIVGSALEDSLNGRMRVSVVATGIEAETAAQRPTILSSRSNGVPAPAIALDAQPRPPELAARPAVQPTLPAAAEQPPATAPNPIFETIAETVAETVSEPVAAPLAGGTEPPALPLSFGDRVPAPKPPQAEPDPLRQRTRPLADDNVDDGPFMAPAPTRPEKDRAPLRRPEALAEAEAINPMDRPTGQKRGRFSFFRRKKAVGADQPNQPVQARLEQDRPNEARQAVPARIAPDVPPKLTQPAIPTESEPPVSEPPAQNSSEAPVSKPSQPLPAPRTEEDLLEIPSFLRRQAN